MYQEKKHLVVNELLDDPEPANTDQTHQWDDETDQALQVTQYGAYPGFLK